MKTLGKRIAKARKSQKMTQNSLAERMNVARTTISNWENGRSQPDLDALRMLSEIFHCDFLANAPQQHENACRFYVNARELPVIDVISHANAYNFTEITVDCSVNCVDQHGNALKFRFFAPFCIESTAE